MKKLVVLFALVSLLALGGQAMAELGTIDNVPAASLLLPRFEVDLDNPAGQNTLFSINNASAAPALAHVTVWSEWSVAVLDFDVYLTGYDVQTLSMYDILVNGNLPVTGSADPLSNLGAWSDPDGRPAPFFPFCSNVGPAGTAYQNPAISAAFRQHLQEWLTGQQSSAFGTCAGDDYGDRIARGYVTVDVTDECSQQFPDSVGYWGDNGTGVPTNDNVLWGDFFMIDRQNAFAQGFSLVHIEADDSIGTDGQCIRGGSFTSPMTFYCRYSTGGDDREALPSKFATRYAAENEFFTGGTDLLSYRDSGELGSPRVCAAPPAYFTEVVVEVFDEEENPFTQQTGGPSGDLPEAQRNPFPRESNRTRVTNQSAAELRVLSTGTFQFGWTFLNLNGATDANEADKHQAWVLTTMNADGQFSVGYDATALNNLTFADTGPVSHNPSN